jgi:predicted metal-binding protein
LTTKVKIPEDSSVLLGSIEPSLGNRGLDFLAAILKRAGIKVQKYENDITSEVLLDEIENEEWTVLALSLTTRESVDTLRNFLSGLGKRVIPPVVIGGLYANPFLAEELSMSFEQRIYYSRGEEDLLEKVSRAMSREADLPPEKGRATKLTICSSLQEATADTGISFLEGSTDLVAFSPGPLKGCPDCPGKRDLTCPIASGYSDVGDFDECRAFVRSFEKAVMMIAPVLEPGTEDIGKRRKIWKAPLETESFFRQKYSRAFAFKFPMRCPVCPPEVCIIQKGKCLFPEFLRPLHEEYCIDMMSTVREMAGDRRKMEMYALVLVGQKYKRS